MRYSRAFQVTVMSSAIVLAICAGRAMAQDAGQQAQIDELANRVTGIETKLDALLELLQKQSSGNTSGSQTSPVSSQASVTTPQTTTNTASTPSGLRPGVNLDIYTIALNRDERLPASPVGVPAGSLIIKGEQPFNLAAFNGMDGLRQYANPSGKSIGQLYTGYVNFEVTGEYVFQASIKKSRNVYIGPDICSTSVLVDGHLIANVVMRVDRGQSEAENGVANLEKGLHQVSLWSICDSRGYDSLLTAQVAVKGPSDRAPKIIDASQFLVAR